MGKHAHSTTAILFINIFLFLLLVSSSDAQLQQNQTTIMKNLYEWLQNDTASSFAWKSVSKDSNPCNSWKGVSCSLHNSSINKLNFSMFSISSSNILPLLCEINTLESLDLSNNHLSTIPNEFMISSCRGNLKVLILSKNRISIPLPSFNGFVKLEYLDLAHNLMVGTITTQFDGLDSIKNLILSYNRFHGHIPTKFGKSNFLEGIQLSNNGFEGQIPEQMANYKSLSLIDLSSNHLSGSIPEKFGELLNLNNLILSSNNLSGVIPQFLLNFKVLSRFAANQNKFTGNIPIGITKYLRNLDLSYNSLNSTIPEDILSGTNLIAVDLSYNNLEGSVPRNISSSLVRLRLGGNSLTGQLASVSFKNLQNLMYLELDNNTLVGKIPPEIGFCRKLALLNLAQNRFTGGIPAELGGLTKLQELKLQQNNIGGEIPNELTRLFILERLNLSGNSLNGVIPFNISSLRNLTNLDLSRNNLNGSIPVSIGQLQSLLELQLGENQLGGDIPTMPRSLQIALNLSTNRFEGLIPNTLFLKDLEGLDLSNNKFTGEIPDFLTKMPGLSELMLSNNQLSGEIPSFKSFVRVNTSGNKYLTNSTSDSTPIEKKKKKTILVGVFIAIAAASFTAGLFALLTVFICRRFHKDKQLHAEEELSLPQLIRGNMLTSNGIHKSNIDFMKAMEEVADSANVILKTKFSTYYKAVMPSESSYFVKKLNWSHKILQLGNHERFGEELEILGKLNNSNVMIPLAYVLTVDSAYLFYEYTPNGMLFDVLHGSSGSSLDWASRYSVAIGVAQGLAFLHGCNSGPILLLDLSSRSILLKSQNEPLIGDIELCKVIDPSKGTGSLSTVAGSVGYTPPEYAYTMRVTMAGNVYSYGVVLLELLTGKCAVSEGTELSKWVLSNSSEPDKILDFNASKASIAIKRQMLAVLKVAIACVNASPDSRPKMKTVLRMLLNSK